MRLVTYSAALASPLRLQGVGVNSISLAEPNHERPIMKPPIWILRSVLIFISALPLHARDKTDVLVMKNGDHMTCEVKGLDQGVLYVSFDYIDGTTSVDWSKVQRLESRQLFLVKTASGEVYSGTLKTPEGPADQPVKIEVVVTEAHEAPLIERSQVVSMIATSDRFWERFNGQIALGLIYAKGNQSTQYSLSSDATYVRERWTAGASFDSNLSSSAGVSTSTRNSLNLTAQHLLPPENWFYAGLGGILTSTEQQIEIQSTVGGGIGRFLKNTNRTRISLLGGAAWQGTTYQSPVPESNNQNLVAGLIYVDARFFRFSKTNFNANATLLPALSEPGRLRVETNAAYYIKIFSNLKWNISFYGNWDNQPPLNLPGSDYGSSSGLSWTFGLK
jgi:Protein of unknown function, DUF481